MKAGRPGPVGPRAPRLYHARMNEGSPAGEVVVEVPRRALVVLVGASGSGKSRFAARHFLPTEVLSSDRIRAMIADDETDQSVSAQAFEILYLLARRRLEAGRLAVADATSTTAEARGALLAVARACAAPAVAVVFDVALEDCLRNDFARSGRSVGRPVVEAQWHAVSRSLGAIAGEGFDRVYVLAGLEAAGLARVVRE